MPRKLCESCGRPLNVCLCAHLVKVVAPCRLVILQHPSELKQPLATVPILQLCLGNMDVYVGEDFSDHEQVQALLNSDLNIRLLFPSEQADVWHLRRDQSDPKADNDSAVQKPDVLLVLDGTWRKAKKMWFLNPALQALPCAVLAGGPEGQYQLRSTSVDGGLSTLEAVTQACNYLSASQHYDVLYEPFNAMIQMQIKKMGPDVFKAHYLKSDD